MGKLGQGVFLEGCLLGLTFTNQGWVRDLGHELLIQLWVFNQPLWTMAVWVQDFMSIRLQTSHHTASLPSCISPVLPFYGHQCHFQIFCTRICWLKPAAIVPTKTGTGWTLTSWGCGDMFLCVWWVTVTWRAQALSSRVYRCLVGYLCLCYQMEVGDENACREQNEVKQ